MSSSDGVAVIDQSDQLDVRVSALPLEAVHSSVVTWGGWAAASQRPTLDLTVDLGSGIGTLRWWRGLGTLLALTAATSWIAQLSPPKRGL